MSDGPSPRLDRDPRSRPTPAFVRFLLRAIIPKDDWEFFLGDLEESPGRGWGREVLGAFSLRLSPGGGGGYRREMKRPPSRMSDMAHELWSDLKFGVRLMIRSPGFTLVALMTMALGIGANTAMFSVVHGVLLKPLPYPEAGRIVTVQETNPDRGWDSFSIAPLNFWDWQEMNRSLDLLAAYRRMTVTRTGGGQAETLRAYRVSADFLEILGGNPVLGRGIAEGDLDPAGEAVAVLSHGFWQRVLGGDPGTLGETLVLDDVPHRIVGILPEEWRPPARAGVDLVLPLKPELGWFENRGSHFLRGIGRIREGLTLDQARGDMEAVTSALASEYPETNAGSGAVIRPLQDVLVGSARSQLLILLASVGLVLLIACANVANMTLARSGARTRELAIRTAIGAGRGRIIRQLLSENMFLAVVGGGLGIGLAYFSVAVFVRGWPTVLPRMEEVGVNGTVLLFSLGVSLLSGVLFGLAPAVSCAGKSLNETLNAGGRGIAGDGARRWIRGGLVVSEVGLAVVLLVGSGLLVRSFSALRSEDPGFVTENRLIFATPVSTPSFSSLEDVLAFQDVVRGYTRGALNGLNALPGVESAGVSSLMPLVGSDEIQALFLEGSPVSSPQDDVSALFFRVTPGYFESMGMPILAGRGVTEDDRAAGPPVVIVSQSFANRFYPGLDPLGERLRFGPDEDEPWAEIVGVVGDVQFFDLGQSTIPQVYVPFDQRPTDDINFVLKTSVPPTSLSDGVRRVIQEADPDLPVVGLRAGDDLIAASVSMPGFRTLLMTGFGLTALFLAVIGLYGVLAYSVSQRSKEIGLRMALGASHGSVLGLVFREGGPLVGVGLGAGLSGAFFLSHVLESMLFGVGARDAGVFVAVPLILVCVAAIAMLLPARKAARVDPMKTLGEE